ncbi:MAG: tRNA lysidine(34) synthetase TilS, partial [Isosphaeraceae bacterium]
MTEPRWLDRLRRRLERWAGASGERRWLVAVSGGSDSVALLRALNGLAPEIGLELVVAHLDHGVRGEAARADAAFVGDLAAALKLPIIQGRWTPTRASHFEADARTARYSWLFETARNLGASSVAVGHTRDDQAETVLQRVVRGTGLRGLAGMPSRRALGPGVTLVRPLLDVSRGELRDYLGAIGQPYREDASNADLGRTRARLRHDLLPKLAAEYNPKVADALIRLASIAREADRAIARGVRGASRRVVLPATDDLPAGTVALSRSGLLKLPNAWRVALIRRAWRNSGWPEGGMDARRWRAIGAWAVSDQARRIDVGAGVVAEVREDRLILSRSGEPPGDP